MAFDHVLSNSPSAICFVYPLSEVRRERGCMYDTRTSSSLLTAGSSSGSVRRLENTAVSTSSSGCSGAALNTADRLPRNSALAG